jgi:hypothetical protein
MDIKVSVLHLGYILAGQKNTNFENLHFWSHLAWAGSGSGTKFSLKVP